MVRQLSELVDVAFDASDVALQLREHFVHVSGDFRHGARQNIEVVVAVHFQFAEIGPEGGVAGRRTSEPLRRCVGIPVCGFGLGTDTVEFVFFLEFGNFALQAFFGEIQGIDQLFKFRHAPDHPRTIDDQLPHGIHHAIETIQSDAYGFDGRGGTRLKLRGKLGF